VIKKYTFGDNCVTGGEDRDGSRYLASGGLSYGPNWNLPNGKYKIEVAGSNLKDCDVSACLNSGETPLVISDLMVSDDRICFTVNVEDDSSGFEVMIQNQSGEEVCLSGIQLKLSNSGD